MSETAARFSLPNEWAAGGRGLLVLRLGRSYHPDGTNGTITLYGKTVCHSIELPWRDNRRNVSCIPEGRY